MRRRSASFFVLIIACSVPALLLADSVPQKVIVLTFDDGPRPAVLKNLLPLLKKEKAPGTFFVIGGEARVHPEWLKQLAREGHEVENHSLSHRNLVTFYRSSGASAIERDITKSAEIIASLTGRKPLFCRPPFWAANDAVISLMRRQCRPVLLGNPDVNTEDYMDFKRPNGSNTLRRRVNAIVHARENRGEFRHVLVFHELDLTVRALEIMIPVWKSNGYQFLRLDELFPQTAS